MKHRKLSKPDLRIERAVPRCSGGSPGFTLLEVMIAVGVLGIAMLALLSLHDSNLQSIIRGQDLSKAAMLAQGMMTQAELERFPVPGASGGNFQKFFPGVYPNFRWQREVEASGMFPDVRKVTITIAYGPRFRSLFQIVEFLHDPEAQTALSPLTQQGQAVPQPGQPAAQAGVPGAPSQGAPPTGQATGFY